jgi:hypothetical protein
MLTFLTVPRIIAIVLVAIGVLVFLTGCKNQAAVLYPMEVAADSAAQSGTSLLTETPPAIRWQDAQKLSQDLHSADAVFTTMLASIKTGQSPVATDVTAALAVLRIIADDLQTTPRGKALAAQIKTRMAASPGAKKITVSEVIMLIDLAEKLTPVIVEAINEIFGNTGPSVDDCQTLLAKFETDVAALDAAIKAASASGAASPK